MEILKQGPISQVTIPEDWIKIEHRRDPETHTQFALYKHKDEQEVTLRFVRPGARIGPQTGQLFLEVIAQPENTQVDTNSAEFVHLSVLTRGAGDPEEFNTNYARVESLNGKKVLVIDGVWKNTGLACLSVFVPAAEGAAHVQEIQLYAPPDRFEQFLPSFKKVLQSIEWV